MEGFTLNCPSPHLPADTVQLAHGGGGRLMHQLIERIFLARFGSGPMAGQHDGAVLPWPGGKLSFTTDSYTVSPLFFPGGDIGKLAVCGTVNDLAMCGARPLWLSAGFILEEGLPMETLERAVESMARTAEACGVRIVTGDTKVVDKGKADGLFINTAGVGATLTDRPIGPAAVRPGDEAVISGDVGRHGVAVMSVREGLEFEGAIESDCAPLAESVAALIEAGVEIHCLRDLTRGGLASALNEIAAGAGVEIRIDEDAVPVEESVRGACELLGLDPLYVANEGRFVAVVAQGHGARAVETLSKVSVSAGACLIGEAAAGRPMVVLRSRFGAERALDLLSGEQLPRIC